MQIPSVEEVGRLLAHADSTRVSTRKSNSQYLWMGVSRDFLIAS